MSKKRRFDLSIVQQGRTHRATGIVSKESDIVAWLNTHYPNWQLANYDYEKGNKLHSVRLLNADYERPIVTKY